MPTNRHSARETGSGHAVTVLSEDGISCQGANETCVGSSSIIYFDTPVLSVAAAIAIDKTVTQCRAGLCPRAVYARLSVLNIQFRAD
jgi:hypothetical protein